MMNQNPDFLSAKPSVVENEVKQEVRQNEGQVWGQINGSQVLLAPGSIIYQNIPSQVVSQQKKLIPSLYCCPRSSFIPDFPKFIIYTR